VFPLGVQVLQFVLGFQGQYPVYINLKIELHVLLLTQKFFIWSNVNSIVQETSHSDNEGQYFGVRNFGVKVSVCQKYILIDMQHVNQVQDNILFYINLANYESMNYRYDYFVKVGIVGRVQSSNGVTLNYPKLRYLPVPLL